MLNFKIENVSVFNPTMKLKNIVAEVHHSDKIAKFVFNKTVDKIGYSEYYMGNQIIAKVPHNLLVIFSEYLEVDGVKTDYEATQD